MSTGAEESTTAVQQPMPDPPGIDDQADFDDRDTESDKHVAETPAAVE